MPTKEIYRRIRDLANELIKRLNAHEQLNVIEKDIISKLTALDGVYLVISGRNRRRTKDKNWLINTTKDSPHMVVLNVMDGEENYYRGSKIYGASISLTQPNTGEHFSVIYDGLSKDIIESSQIKVNNPRLFDISDDSVSNSHKNHSERLVMAFGRLLSISNDTVRELSDVSVRWFGSTTVTILEILRNHVDLYLNTTKIWNFWWSLWLDNKYGLQFEDAITGKKIKSQTQELLLEYDQTIPLLCYKDPLIKNKLSKVIANFAECIKVGGSSRR